jgi:hypothetical protein
MSAAAASSRAAPAISAALTSLETALGKLERAAILRALQLARLASTTTRDSAGPVFS